ncbi:MAG: hemolysin D, partial [Pirellulales bacterium]|nr:hemolysin D [Pirellulales bacterium]
FLLSLCLIISAATLVVVRFDAFQSRLPSFYQFFSPDNLLWLAVVLGATKVFHEFGHGLTCKHFGGECHEMGVMILVLTPCLYCNVSDSWMLPSKWKRAAIGAAGMYVEVVIASLAVFVWWATADNPGILNMVCLNVVFISSVSTILFNANPLLRYDGYYILADVLEIPNLRQKATTILNRKMAEWFLGIEQPDDPFLPQRNQVLFAIYSVASVIYRWVVVLSILWFLHQVFKQYGLQIIGHIMVAMSLFGLLVMPFYKLYKYFSTPGRMQKVKKPYLIATLIGLVALILFVFLVPLPHSVMCTFEIHPSDPGRVYVDVPGILDEIRVEPGQKVEKGEVVALLSNIDVDFKTAELTGQRNEYQVQLVGLKQLSHLTSSASGEIESVRESLKSIEEQLDQQKIANDKLTLRAPCNGTVISPTWKPYRPGVKGQLPSWWGSPLEKRNLGIPLEAGDVFCLVGDPTKMEAVLYIDQGDIEFVDRDQAVELNLDELPFRTFEGQIDDLSRDKAEVTPAVLSTRAGGELPSKVDEAGVDRPQSAVFPAKVYLDNPNGLLQTGLRGRAKIHTRGQTIADRVVRMFYQLFNFKL